MKISTLQTTENSTPKCRYLDLDPVERSIRLIRIKPLDPEDDESSLIRCDLLDNISLTAMRGKYTTISYSAGNPNQTEVIIVNDFCFNTFSNLGHALRQARHFWKDKFDKQELLLWVDQVNLMGDIYATAEQVLICLSTEHDIAGGIGWLHCLSRDLLTGCRFPFKDERYEDDDRLNDFFHVNWHDEDFHLGWDAFIRTFLTSSWWSRAWVRQEFIRSHQAYFMAAFESIHWKLVADIIDIYYNAVYVFENSPPDFHHLSSQSAEPPDSCQACLLGNDPAQFWEAGKRADRLLKAKIRAESQPGRFGDLLYNLCDSHLCKASDPRDLIYAFLGFSDHGYGVYPDYSLDISLQDVLSQLARNVISHNNNLDILEMAYLTRSGTIDPGIPSCVPDWRKVPRFQDGHFIEGRISCTTKTFFSFQPDERGHKYRVLQARGVLHEVLQSQIRGWPRQFLSATGDEMPTVGMAEEGDEVWMLYGASNLFILRRQEQYYKVFGEVLDQNGILPKVHRLVEEVKTRAETNHPTVKLINIC